LASRDERAYLAGILDGEGCIGMTHKRPDFLPNCYAYYIQITNSDENLINWIQERFGGKARRARYTVWQIAWYGKEPIRNLLMQVEEFLIVKRVQAKAMLEFCQTPKYWEAHREYLCDKIQLDKR